MPNLLTSGAYAVGRGVGKTRPAATSASGQVGVLGGAVAVGALWGAVSGWVNLRRCKKGQVSKQKALRDTASEAVGTGVATGLGVAAANVVRASAVAASSVALVPFLVGTAVTGGAKILWDKKLADKRPHPRAEESGVECGSPREVSPVESETSPDTPARPSSL